MKTWQIISKTFGKHDVLVDDKDFKALVQLGGKWCLSLKRGYFYAQKRLPGNKLVEMQRFLMNPPSGLYVDHINGNTLDNRRCNLRVCKNSTNIRNGKVRKNNKTGHQGVHCRNNLSGNKWYAKIRVNYQIINIGTFNTFEEAVEARKLAQQKYWSV